MIDIDYNWSFTDMAMNFRFMVNYEKISAGVIHLPKNNLAKNTNRVNW